MLWLFYPMLTTLGNYLRRTKLQLMPLLLHQTRALKAAHEERIQAVEAYEARIKALEEKIDALLR